MTLKENSPAPSAVVLALIVCEQLHVSLTPIKKQHTPVKRRKPADARDAWIPAAGDHPVFAEPLMRIILSTQRYMNHACCCYMNWPYLCTVHFQITRICLFQDRWILYSGAMTHSDQGCFVRHHAFVRTLIFLKNTNQGWKEMYQCPHCGQPAISALRKTVLGPGVPVACQSCGKAIKITYPAWVKAAVPGALVMVAALFFESNLLVYGLSIAGLVLMIALHLLWVPLVKEE
jgi:hypothetical protein